MPLNESWLEKSSRYYRDIPNKLLSSPPQSDEDTEILLALNDYLTLVERKILPFDSRVSKALTDVLLNPNSGSKLRQLAFKMYQICFRIESNLSLGLVSSLSFQKTIPGIIRRDKDRIVVSLNALSHEPMKLTLSPEELGPLYDRLEDASKVAIKLIGSALLINEEAQLKYSEETEEKNAAIPSRIREFWNTVIVPDTNRSKKAIEIQVNRAYQTYLANEVWLMKEHRGEYVWIVEDEIKEISENLTQLLKKAEKTKSNPNQTIVREIEYYPECIRCEI